MWRRAVFTPPAPIAAMRPQLASAVATQAAALEIGVGALEALGLPQGGSGGSSDDLREQAKELLAGQVAYLAVTPYHHGIGSRRGEQAYLTPEAAIAAVAGRLQDIALPAGGTGLVLLLLAAPEPARLATDLALFNQVFPVPETLQAERRARALAGLEADKLRIPLAPGWPAWRPASPERDATGLAISRSLGAQLAAAEGLDAAWPSPVERLAAFADKVSASMSRRQADLDALLAGMSGQNSGWHGTYLEGDGPDLARQIRSAAPPLDAAYKCSLAVCWYGPVGRLAYYKEVFGL